MLDSIDPLPIIVVVFGFFGLTGNAIFLSAVVRNEKLRTKHGYLLAVTVIVQTICLIFTIILEFNSWRFHSMTQRECVNRLTVFLFFIFMLSGMILTIACDILTAITVPFKHRAWGKLTYVGIMSTPSLCLAITVIALFHVYSTDTVVEYCSLIYAIPEPLSPFVTLFLLFLSVVSLFVATIASFKGIRHDHSMQSARRSYSSDAIRDTQISRRPLTAFVFILTWLVCVIITHVMAVFKNSFKWSPRLRDYACIFALLTYSQTFYVLFVRYPRYQKIFKRHLHWMSCGYLYKSFEQGYSERRIPGSDVLECKKSNNNVALSRNVSV